MKSVIFSISTLGLFNFTSFASTLQIAVGGLRDSGGNLVTPNSAWALIVSNSAGGLPGGLTDGGPIGTISQIVADFDGVSLTSGNKGGYTILQTGIASGEEVVGPGYGIAFGNIVIYDSPIGPILPYREPGAILGIYWFPNKSPGSTLTGTYEVGGFAQSTPNVQSGGFSGTVVPNLLSLGQAYFFETNFNQDVLMQGSTGLGAERFTAVAVPEISSLTFSSIGLSCLLNRRRK